MVCLQPAVTQDKIELWGNTKRPSVAPQKQTNLTFSGPGQHSDPGSQSTNLGQTPINTGPDPLIHTLCQTYSFHNAPPIPATACWHICILSRRGAGLLSLWMLMDRYKHLSETSPSGLQPEALEPYVALYSFSCKVIWKRLIRIMYKTNLRCFGSVDSVLWAPKLHNLFHF